MNSVPVVMMSGKEFLLSLANVEAYADLMSEVVKVMKPKRGIRFNILDDERVLSSGNPRLILTDDSYLTIVLSKGKK